MRRSPDKTGRIAPSLAPRLARTSAVAITLAVLGACGGGGDGTGNTGPTATGADSGVTLSSQATPTDAASAVKVQYVRVAEIRQVIAELQTGEEAALQALIANRPDDWEHFWDQQYPSLLDKLDKAATNLQRSEDDIQRLVYGLSPAGTGGGTSAKFVPIPLVLVAVASISGIVALEKSGYRDRFEARSAAERASIEEQLRQIYVNSGMDEGVARVRAQVDAARVSVLWGLQKGIDKARWFVFENGLMPAFGSLLPEIPQALLDLKDALSNVLSTKDNVEVIMTSKSCRTNPPGGAKSLPGSVLDPERSGTHAPIDAKAVTGCRIYFCSTGDARCTNLPEGDWEAVVLAPDHLRDVDLDVSAPGGGTARVQATPIAAADIEPPPPLAQCSSVQNAGGDTADTRTVPLGRPSGSFSLSYQMFTIKDQIRVLYDGRTLFDSGCVGGSKTQLIPYSGLASFVTIQVTPNCSGNTSGTAWNYTVACPSN